jgi:hypothetical protein
VALGVYAYEHGGTEAVGIAGLVRLLPAAIIAPFAASLGDHFRRCAAEDCYSRSIDQPAPQDGLLPCATCGGALEFRQMPQARTGAAPSTSGTASA